MALLAFAAANPVGVWDCEATTPEGDRLPWTLQVAKDSQNLKVVARSNRGEIAVPDAQLEGDTLTFSVPVDGQKYQIKLTFEGDALKGNYKGGEATGPISGKRRSS